MNPSQEFQVGKHSIGWISSDIKKYAESQPDFTEAQVPRYQTLSRYMTDAEIESSLKPGMASLAELLAFLDNPPLECKDGNWNLFYFPSFVVGVDWDAMYGYWSVHAWGRDGSGWGGGRRVFSPATESSIPQYSASDSLSFESLDLRLKKLEKLVNPDLLK